MFGSKDTEKYMTKVAETIDRHIQRSTPAWVDIYNRCFEAVDKAMTCNERIKAERDELLEACNILVKSYMEPQGTYALSELYDAREKARAAIAKAKGGDA